MAYTPLRKCIVFTAIATAAALGASAIGAAAAARARRAAASRQRQEENAEDAWYKRRYNEDYADTAAGQNLIRRAKDFAKENWKKAAGAQAVAGGTDAATAQAKEAGNRMVGDTIANIAASDQDRKNEVDNMHRQASQQFMQMDIARENQRAADITNAAQNASNAIMNLGGAASQASAARKPSLMGGSNEGVSSPSSVVAVNNSVNAGYSNAITRNADNSGRALTDDELWHFERAAFS